MAEPFYRGAKQEQIGKEIGAMRGPDMSGAQQSSDRRTKSIIQGLDGLVTLGKGVAKVGQDYSDKKQKEAAIKGAAEAHEGKESTAKHDLFSLDSQQDAYDDVKSEVAVAGLPQYVNEHMSKNPDIKKPLDELTPEELKSYMGKARSDYFKEQGLDDSPIRQKAEAHANELSDKQFGFLVNKSQELRDSKAQAQISQLVTKRVNAFQGSPKDIDESLAVEMQKYQQSLGDPTGVKTRSSIMTGLLQSVMSDQPNLSTLSYLKSDEAKERFGDLDGFNAAVTQADKFSTKAQNAQIMKEKSALENQFYGLLNNGGFTTAEEVKQELDSYPDSRIDQGDKFTLYNKAVKYLKLSQEADGLQDAIAQKQFGVVNAAKQDALVAAFERNVMPKSADLDSILNYDGDGNDPESVSQNAFTKWVMDGYNVPNYVKDHLNSPINAGNTQVWDKRLATYQRMSQRLGPTGVAKLYTSDTQASLDEFAALTADTTMKPEDRKQALTNFMEGAKMDRITGISTNASIRKEIMDDDKGIMESLQKFAAEGGGDTTLDFGVPDDLQPYTTTRSNSDTGPQGYAVKSLSGNYSIYRRQNPNENPEVALRKAKNDFLNQNYWVDWTDKSTYVPREFGANFAVRGMQYIKDSGIISRLSVSEGLPTEVIERRVTIEPSSDYHSSRKMSIFYDGIEQNEKFTFEQFDKRVGVLSASERKKIEQADSDRRNSKEYKERNEKLQKMNKSLRTFGFGMN